YIRHGLFPRLPLYMVSGVREAVAARLPKERLRAVEIDHSAAHQAALSIIDGSALDVWRTEHHRFLAHDPATRGGLIYDENGGLAGYFYVNSSGHIGPFAVTRPEIAEAAFVTALHGAVAMGAAQVSAFIPGTAEAALRMAIESGLQIAF